MSNTKPGVMVAYLKLFRWPNLLIIAITQYLFRYAIVGPLLHQSGYDLTLSDFDFFLLVLSTLLISAAGYAINDYFDLRTDRINKPHKIILGKEISRRSAIFYHSLFNFIAVVIGLYLAISVDQWNLVFIFLVIPMLLWLYSLRYKRKFLLGNLIVGLLAAFVIAIVWVFEYHAIAANIIMDRQTNAIITTFANVYCLFALLSTVGREIIKDIEDMKGDAKIGCRTLPIVSGIRVSKKITIVINLGIIGFVAYLQIFLSQLNYHLLFAYVILAIQIPLVLMIHKTQIAMEKSDYSNLSKFSKVIMLSGLSTMLLFYFYFQRGIFPI